jgi:hypothetical protein
MSQHLAHFTFDLFLSYGWAGIEGPDDGDRGWISEFKRVLDAQLSSELGRRARIHLDVEQSTNGELPENLRRAVTGSVAFLSVISPGSCRPDSWCHKELDWFVRECAEPLANRRQMFSMLLRDVKRDQWPETLRGIVPINFLNEMTPRGPVPRSELHDAATDGGNRVQGLAIQIARVLEEAERQIARTVLLVCSAPSLQPHAERLATEIIKGGGVPVRLNYQDQESQTAFHDRCMRALTRASLMVCLLDERASATPPGWLSSVERGLMEAANLRFTNQRHQVIVWRDGAGPDQDWPDAQNLKNMGFEYLHSLLNQTFQSNVACADAHIVARQQIRAEFGPRGTTEARYVFVECVETDLERLAPLREAFRAKGYRVKFPLFQGDAALRRKEDLGFLTRCHAAAVYFGSRNDLEAYLACQVMADTISDQALLIPRAVLLDPPNDPVRKFFEYPDFTNYPYNPDEFVSSIVRERQ